MVDFDAHSFVGFWFAMIALPTILAKKGDALGQEAFSGDMTDTDNMEDMLDNLRKANELAIKNEPQIKVMLGGAFRDMIKKGIFD